MSERFQLPVVANGGFVLRDAVQIMVGQRGEVLPVGRLLGRCKLRISWP
jgi:hypothetical protein